MVKRESSLFSRDALCIVLKLDKRLDFTAGKSSFSKTALNSETFFFWPRRINLGFKLLS